MSFILLVAASLMLAYANGSNDNFKATATVYGSGVLSYRQSLALATLAQIAGSVASLFLAAALIKAFGGKGLVPNEIVADPKFLLAVGTGAAVSVLVATRFGIPISTTHALVGGLVGAGLALSPSRFHGEVLGRTYFLPLLTSPLLALTLSAFIYPVASRLRQMMHVNATTCFCVGETMESVATSPDGELNSHCIGLLPRLRPRAE